MNVKSNSSAEDNLTALRARLEAESSDSVMLLKNPKDNPICTITHDEKIPAIVVVWKQHATSTQFKFIHETILHLLKKHEVCKVLGDDTHLPTIHAEDRAWVVENWMPRAIEMGLRFACSKKPKSYFGRVSVNSVQSIAPSGLTLRSFDKLDEAKFWLQEVGTS